MTCLATVGLGVITGSFLGGNSRAARTPEQAPATTSYAPAAIAHEAPAAISAANTTWISKTVRSANASPLHAKPAAPPPPAAVKVIALRFPARWQKSPEGDRIIEGPKQTLAYASEAEPAHRNAAAEAYGLASVEPVHPTAKKHVARHVRPKKQTLFNEAQIASIKKRLRLTPEQEQYWPPVAAALRAIAWRQEHQTRGRHRHSTLASIDPNSPEVQQLKTAAFPLIMTLTEQQKSEVRQLAHTMGLNKVASMI